MTDFIPNSFQTPNDYVDQFMHLLTPEEWKVLTYTVRRIFGFQKRQDRISLSQYEHGARSSEGVQLDHGTGLARPTIIRALAALEQYGLQVMVEPNDRRVNEGACYTLQLSAGKVDVAGLEQRAEEGKQRGRARTENAREMTPRHTRAGGKSDLLPLSDSGQSHLPANPVSGTDRSQLVGLTSPSKSDIPIPVSPTYTQNTGEIQEEIQRKHTHTAAPTARAPANARACKVCVCSTPHKSKLCDDERIRIASNMIGVNSPERYAMTLEARRGTYDATFLQRQKELRKPGAVNQPERDTSACPDCEGKGLFYPAGNTTEGRLKGVVKCTHPRLDEELERLRREALDVHEGQPQGASV